MSNPSSAHGTESPDEAVSGLSAEQIAAIEGELGRVVESGEFRTSPRCQEFLRYIVRHALNSPHDSIKERNIGVDVFHRSPEYEPNSDSIVRVRATEVRKRLTQHYDHREPAPELRIVLATGSYVPEFRWTKQADPAPAPVPETRLAGKRNWRIAAVALGAVVLAFAAWIGFRAGPTELDEFWRPVLESSKPVVICLGQPVVYHLSRRVHENYLKTLPSGRTPGPYVIPLKKGDVEAEDILPVPDQYVGAGSAQAAAQLSAFFASQHKRAEVRIGNDLSSYDLRNRPAVLEGAFSNDWTMKLMSSMPLAFVQEGTLRGIRDTKAVPSKGWYLHSLDSSGRTAEGYGLVSRVLNSDTMEPLVSIAGITQYGTQAAGELVSDASAFAAAIQSAPKGWQKRNLQMLLHLRVIGRIPGKPEVMAVRTW